MAQGCLLCTAVCLAVPAIVTHCYFTVAQFVYIRVVPQSVFERKRPQDAKLIHVMSSGLKAAATWSRVEILQNCRECCGGMGFLAANKIGPMKTDMDVDVTFEGDNTVMMQQVGGYVVLDQVHSCA